jgi:hypothetical protein
MDRFVKGYGQFLSGSSILGKKALDLVSESKAGRKPSEPRKDTEGDTTRSNSPRARVQSEPAITVLVEEE